MAVQVNFVIDQGALFEGIATIQTESGSVFNLTGMTPYAQMRKSYYSQTAVNIGVTVYGDPTAGQIQLRLTPDQTDAVRAGRYVYDVEVHSNADPDYVKRVLQGIITISPQVTKPVV